MAAIPMLSPFLPVVMYIMSAVLDNTLINAINFIFFFVLLYCLLQCCHDFQGVEETWQHPQAALCPPIILILMTIMQSVTGPSL